jgi:hypothetical protein
VGPMSCGFALCVFYAPVSDTDQGSRAKVLITDCVFELALELADGLEEALRDVCVKRGRLVAFGAAVRELRRGWLWPLLPRLHCHLGASNLSRGGKMR